MYSTQFETLDPYLFDANFTTSLLTVHTDFMMDEIAKVLKTDYIFKKSLNHWSFTISTTTFGIEKTMKGFWQFLMISLIGLSVWSNVRL